MTYSILNFLFWLAIWFAASVWMVLDAERLSKKAWTLAGESQNVWSVISIFLAWPFGLLFYLVVVRRGVSKISKNLAEEEIITRATDRLRAEHYANQAYEAPKASEPVKTSDAPEAPSYEKTEDSVFDYEGPAESSDNAKPAFVAPPLPDRDPKVPARKIEDAPVSNSEELSDADNAKTSVYIQ